MGPLRQGKDCEEPRKQERKPHPFGWGLTVGKASRKRGIHVEVCMSFQKPGTSPAYTGNIVVLMVALSGAKGHPRICGEHEQELTIKHPTTGPSPYVRGTQWCLSWKTVSSRAISVCTGNIYLQIVKGRSIKDHPRMHGEHTKEIPGLTEF